MSFSGSRGQYKRRGFMECQSPFTKPAVKKCPFRSCGVEIQDDHWACRMHWEKMPKKLRNLGNVYKAHWAGDFNYDQFIDLCRDVDRQKDEGTFDPSKWTQKSSEKHAIESPPEPPPAEVPTSEPQP